MVQERSRDHVQRLKPRVTLGKPDREQAEKTVPFTTGASANSIADPLQRGTKSLIGRSAEGWGRREGNPRRASLANRVPAATSGWCRAWL
jgi:hypothetical protein